MEQIEINGRSIYTLKLVEIQQEIKNRGGKPKGSKEVVLAQLIQMLKSNTPTAVPTTTPIPPTTPIPIPPKTTTNATTATHVNNNNNNNNNQTQQQNEIQTAQQAAQQQAAQQQTTQQQTAQQATQQNEIQRAQQLQQNQLTHLALAQQMAQQQTTQQPPPLPSPQSQAKKQKVKTPSLVSDINKKSPTVKKTTVKKTVVKKSKTTQLSTSIKSDLETCNSLFNKLKEFDFSPILKRITFSNALYQQNQPQLPIEQSNPLRIELESLKYIILKLMENDYSSNVQSKLSPPPMIRRFIDDMSSDTFTWESFNQLIKNHLQLTPTFKIYNQQDRLYDELEVKRKRYLKTLESYRKYFGVDGIEEIWPKDYYLQHEPINYGVSGNNNSTTNEPEIPMPEEPITIKFKTCCSTAGDELVHEIKTNTKLGQTMKNVISELGLSSGSFRDNFSFKFGKTTVYNTSTPFGLSMKNNDVIVVYLKNIYQDDKKIGQITVTLWDNDTKKRTYFSIGRHSPLKKLTNSFLTKKGVHPESIKFSFKGQPILSSNTCCDLKILDGDIIDASTDITY